MEPRSISAGLALRTGFLLLMFSMLTACYSDMQYGIEEPSEEEANEQWWCNFYNNCPSDDGNIWGSGGGGNSGSDNSE